MHSSYYYTQTSKFSLDELTDRQQHGRRWIDCDHVVAAAAVDRVGGPRNYTVVGPLFAGRRSRVPCPSCTLLVGHSPSVLGGPAPTVDDGWQGRTARTRQRRADGTVSITVNCCSGPTAATGHGPDGGAAAGPRRREVPVQRALLAQQQRPKGVPEVLQVIRVQQRVAGGVEVWQDDAAVHEGLGHGAVVAERLYAVDGVQRHPTDGEERDDYRQVLRGLHLAFPGRAQHTQFRRTVAAALTAIQQRHLFDLKRYCEFDLIYSYNTITSRAAWASPGGRDQSGHSPPRISNLFSKALTRQFSKHRLGNSKCKHYMYKKFLIYFLN